MMEQTYKKAYHREYNRHYYRTHRTQMLQRMNKYNQEHRAELDRKRTAKTLVPTLIKMGVPEDQIQHHLDIYQRILDARREMRKKST
jgi:hypothetical protein